MLWGMVGTLVMTTILRKGALELSHLLTIMACPSHKKTIETKKTLKNEGVVLNMTDFLQNSI